MSGLPTQPIDSYALPLAITLALLALFDVGVVVTLAAILYHIGAL